MRQAAFLSIAFVVCSSACSEVAYRANQDHCALNEGDRYCVGLFPERPYCAQGQGECALGDRFGCVAEVSAECHAACGELNADECSVAEGSGTETGTSSSGASESSSGTSESSTTGPMPCVSDEECTDAEAPFCGVTGECGTCDGTADPDAACAGVDPGLPLCVGDTCVACTPENPVVCDEQLLLCDGGSNACVPCSEHGQCSSGACELAAGTCFPADFVVEVDGDEPAMPPMMYASIDAAVAAVGTDGVIVVHELDGGVSYQEAVTIDGDKHIALLAAPGEAPIIQGTGGNPGISVQGAGTILYIEGLRVAGNTAGLGLQVDDAFAWVDRSRIVQNSGGGVLAENGAELTLRNCFVARNGDEFVDSQGITATGSSLDVRYSTIAANDGSGGAISLSCDAAATGEVRNSIVAAGDDTIACPNVSFSFSVVDTAGLTGSDNDVLPFAPAWFPNIAMSDFHVAAGPPFADVAQWSTGDPLTDIDGEPRPAIDATPDYAGADVPQ